MCYPPNKLICALRAFQRAVLRQALYLPADPGASVTQRRSADLPTHK
jgi:hypothetical protein